MCSVNERTPNFLAFSSFLEVTRGQVQSEYDCYPKFDQSIEKIVPALLLFVLSHLTAEHSPSFIVYSVFCFTLFDFADLATFGRPGFVPYVLTPRNAHSLTGSLCRKVELWDDGHV